MNQREAFEKWAKENYSRSGYVMVYGLDIYAYDDVQLLWAAWQSAAAIERESCAKVCDYYATAIDLRGNEYIRSGDCKRAAELIRDRK